MEYVESAMIGLEATSIIEDYYEKLTRQKIQI